MGNFLRLLVSAVACAAWLLFCSAHAQENNFGASFIGFCSRHWPCKSSLSVFDGLPVKRVGWLSVTFGERCSCARKFLQLPGRKYVRVHLINGTCFPERGRVCGSNEPFRGETIASADRKLRRRNPRLIRRYRRNLQITRAVLGPALSDPATQIRLSLCLECPLGKRARTTLLRVAREEFLQGRFVDSVLTQRCLPGLVCERHGTGALLTIPCIGDTDGEDYRTMDVARFGQRAARCESAFLWAPPFNLIDPRRTAFQYPPQRTLGPTARDFAQLASRLRESTR